MSYTDPFIEYLRLLSTEEGRVHLVPTLYRGDLALASESLDFVKFARQQSDFVLGLPPELEEQRVADLRGDTWFLPALLVHATSDAVRDASLSVTLNLVSSYIYDRLRTLLPGNKADAQIRLFHQSAEGVFEFSYSGPADLLASMTVREVVANLVPLKASIPVQTAATLPASGSAADPVDENKTPAKPKKKIERKKARGKKSSK